jgi:hypothetical protein
MEEFDSHTEHATEQAHEAAHESRERWITGVALTAARLAALAAITSMLAGHHEHEAMMQQLEAADQWNFYQAKGIKGQLREVRLEGYRRSGETPPAELAKTGTDYKAEQSKIKQEAEAIEASAGFHDHLHTFFATAVTLFQVAIAVSAISALTRRRAFWLVGIGLGVLALGALTAGLLVSGGIVGDHPPDPKPHASANA